MSDTIPVIWGQTSDGEDAYVKTCTAGVYNPETGKTIDKEMATCIPESGENLPPTPIDADTLQGHAADYFLPKILLDFGTEEQWTGALWVDGKKIWKRTYPFTISAIDTSVFVDLGVQVDVSPCLPDAFVESEDGSFRFFPGINGSSAPGGNLVAIFGNRAPSHKNTLNIATNIQTLIGRQGYATVYYTKVEGT